MFLARRLPLIFGNSAGSILVTVIVAVKYQIQHIFLIWKLQDEEHVILYVQNKNYSNS
jgi:hypothetical protein